MPLEHNGLSLDEAWRLFSQLHYYRLGAESRADWVANGVLYLPLGFLATRTVLEGLPRHSVWAVALAWSACATLAVAVEFTQLFFPPRTVSQNDLIAEFIGAGLGVLLAPLAARRATALAQAWRLGGVRLLPHLLEVYALAYLALCFFPYDLVLSSTELAAKADHGSWGWVLGPSERGAFFVALQLAVEAALVMPIGWLLARRWPRGEVPLRVALLVGALLGLVVEVGQFFILSGVSQGLSVLTRALGVVLGARWLVRQMRQGIEPVRRGLARHSGWLLLLYLPLLLVASGWLRAPWQGWTAASTTWAQLRLLPFYYHYYTTEALALFSLGSVALMYVPVAAIGWARGATLRATVLVAATLAAAVEVSKLFLAGMRPDPTNVLIAMAACAAAHGLLSVPQRVPTAGVAAEADGPRPPGATLRPQWLLWPLVVGAMLYALSFPAFALALTGLLMLCAALVWRQPVWALAIVPAALPVLDLAPWSGRLFWDEFDLLMLVCIAVAWMRLPRADGPRPAAGVQSLLWGLFGISLVLSFLRALIPWPAIDDNSLNNLFSAFNALRIAKGALWAWLFIGLYRALQDHAVSRSRSLGVGMCVGLALTVLAILWERAAFVGLFDFSTDYRVTGLFSAMHRGGAYIECYLAVTTAYAVFGLLRAASWPARLAMALLLAGASYSMMVTYSRNGYAALAVVVTLALIVHAAQRPGGARRRGLAPAVLLIALVASAPALLGPYARERLANSVSDLRVRQAHWADALALRDEGWVTALVGMGLGRFAETHYWHSKEAVHAASHRLEVEEGNRFLRLGAGAPTYHEQMLALKGSQSLTLSLALRSSQPSVETAGLTVSICEKWTLTSARCQSAQLKGQGVAGAWWGAQALFDLRPWAEAEAWPPRPVKLSVHSPTSGAAVDIDKLHLRDERGRELLRNGDFDARLDHWFFATDVDPPWHIHSMPVAWLFDQGWLGVAAWAALLLAAMAAGLAQRRASGAGVAAVALCGFLSSGLLNTLIDTPRFLWLVLVLAALALAERRNSPA